MDALEQMDKWPEWGPDERLAVDQYRLFQANLQKKRQAAGIAAAKARGVRFGRPRIETPENFGEIVVSWQDKKISLQTALQLCGMSQTTFFRRLKQYRLECGIEE